MTQPEEVVEGLGGSSAALPALVVEGLSKRFGPTIALADVGFSIARGEIHGLLGGNGSGKSTLIKILAGVHAAEPGGTLTFGAETVAADAMSPRLARQNGLRFVHQVPGMFASLTVTENLAMGAGFPTRCGLVRWREMRRMASRLLDNFEVHVSPDVRVGDLRPADQTMVAVARALRDREHNESSILVLDEPTASLPEHEVEVLLAAVRRFAAQGHAILYVSHRLDEVLATVDRITVLRDGALVATKEARAVTKEQLIGDIVGRPLKRVFAENAERTGDHEPVLKVNDLRGGPIRGADFTVRAGEIVGVAGLLGSGRTELLQMLFGALPREAGAIVLGGRAIDPKGPADGMAAGMAYIPEDREAEACFLPLSVRENVVLGKIASYWRRGRFDRRRQREDTAGLAASLRIKMPSQDAPLSALSGGNRQKVVLSRWLARDPRLFLLDEPTQGIDIGARADVYSAIRERVNAGVAAILVSSDFEELAHASDRVIVLQGGRIATEVDGVGLTSQRLTELVYSKQVA